MLHRFLVAAHDGTDGGRKDDNKPKHGNNNNSSSNGLTPPVKPVSIVRKVIIVDDVPELTDLYSRILELHGHTVAIVAHSGEELRSEANRESLVGVDVALVDFRLGGTEDGFAVARTILRHSPPTKIVIASADESVRKEASAVGFRFLKKPFTINEMLEAIM